MSSPTTSPAEAPEPEAPAPPGVNDQPEGEEAATPPSGFLGGLGLARFDVIAMGALLVVAFVFRFFSPIMPDFLTGTGFISNCVHNTPVDPRGDRGTLCGLAYPFQRAGADGNPKNGQVFDEVYFPVFGYDDLKGISYFDPEPPLAKYLIAAGEVGYGEWRKLTEGVAGDPADLGFNTFGWRIMVCIIGTLTVPLMYLFAFKLWPNRWFATAAGVLCCFDGMFFIQSRIGIIEIVPVFFIMLAYTLFLFHLRSRTQMGAIVTLLLTGVVLGLAISSKWTALAALASIVLWLVLRALPWSKEIVEKLRLPRGLPGGARPALYAYTAVVALAAFPIAIYLLSWIPFFTRGQFHTFGDLLTYNYEVYQFHATLTATHPYGSKWYTWPFMIRPVAYYFEGDGLGIDAVTGQNLVAGMINLGNPVIWWASVPAVISLPYFIIKDRSWPATLILVGYLTQYLPFIKITRVMFLYHYFGALIFAILALAFVLSRMHLSRLVLTVRDDEQGGAVAAAAESVMPTGWIIPAFLVLAIAGFLYFYPVWTALPISFPSYITGFPAGHMWLGSWI